MTRTEICDALSHNVGKLGYFRGRLRISAEVLLFRRWIYTEAHSRKGDRRLKVTCYLGFCTLRRTKMDSKKKKGQKSLEVTCTQAFPRGCDEKAARRESRKRNIPVTGSQPFALHGGLASRCGFQEHVRTQYSKTIRRLGHTLEHKIRIRAHTTVWVVPSSSIIECTRKRRGVNCRIDHDEACRSK